MMQVAHAGGFRKTNMVLKQQSLCYNMFKMTCLKSVLCQKFCFNRRSKRKTTNKMEFLFDLRNSVDFSHCLCITNGQKI